GTVKAILSRLVMSVIDSITTPAAVPEKAWRCQTNHEGSGRKEPDNDHYRSRLSPGLPTDCVCGYGNGRLWRAAIATPGGSGEVLSRSRSPGNEGARGDGSQWTCTLVRATAGGAEHRVMDR